MLATDFGDANREASGLWLVIGCLLLWIVYRKRSRVARGVVIVTSLVGAVIYGLAALRDPHAPILALAYLAQAVPLLPGQVRQHVMTRA